MKYALRITRSFASGDITVHPIMRVRNTTRPYLVKQYAQKVVESLQVFNTKAEAELAAEGETLIARKYAPMTREERYTAFLDDIAYFKSIGVQRPGLCALLDINWSMMKSYITHANPPNPRVCAKLYLFRRRIEAAAEEVKKMLPADGGVGRFWGSMDYAHRKI